MNAAEFFTRLRGMKLPWHVDELGRVRVRLAWSFTPSGRATRWVDSAPINVVADSTGTGFPFHHGLKLGLSPTFTRALWAAEDGKAGAVRRELLKACRLKERP